MTEGAPAAEAPAGTAGLRAGCCERYTLHLSGVNLLASAPAAESGFPQMPGSWRFCLPSLERR